jgi:hypothetical protein
MSLLACPDAYFWFVTDRPGQGCGAMDLTVYDQTQVTAMVDQRAGTGPQLLVKAAG